jgi:hypothetical protein
LDQNPITSIAHNRWRRIHRPVILIIIVTWFYLK